jgi:hypothetical protein
MKPYLYAIGAVIALLVVGQAYRMGYSAAMGEVAQKALKAQKAAFAAAEIASRKEAQRLALEAQRDDLARQLEDAANADADADRVCLGADSVQRLRAR